MSNFIEFVIAILRWDFGNHYIHYRFEQKEIPPGASMKTFLFPNNLAY